MRYTVPVVLAGLMAFAPGCSQRPPITANGKPVSHWLEAMSDPDPKVRRKAVIELGHVGTADPAIIPALMEAVKDRFSAVRCEAILALSNLGSAAEEAIPVLQEAQKDADPKVRSYVMKALERIKTSE
jgi:HEAT repeat protein